MDWKRRLAGRMYTHLYLQGYEHGTRTEEYYEEYLLLSGQPLGKARALSNYSLLVEPRLLDTGYYVWISRTLRPKPVTGLSPPSLALITGYLAS